MKTKHNFNMFKRVLTFAIIMTGSALLATAQEKQEDFTPKKVDKAVS